MVGSEIASDSTPTMIRMKVTNSRNLSATRTPKLDAPSFQSSTDEMAAPARPMAPSGPIGIRSPGARNASAIMAAMAAAVTQDMGTIALNEDINLEFVIPNCLPGVAATSADSPGRSADLPMARSASQTG